MGGISFNDLPPPTPDDAAATSLFNLLVIIADPNAAKETLTKITAALSQANAEIDAAKEAQTALDAAREEQAQSLKKERDEHDRSLAETKDKSDHDSAMSMDGIRAQRANAG